MRPHPIPSRPVSRNLTLAWSCIPGLKDPKRLLLFSFSSRAIRVVADKIFNIPHALSTYAGAVNLALLQARSHRQPKLPRLCPSQKNLHHYGIKFGVGGSPSSATIYPCTLGPHLRGHFDTRRTRVPVFHFPSRVSLPLHRSFNVARLPAP